MVWRSLTYEYGSYTHTLTRPCTIHNLGDGQPRTFVALRGSLCYVARIGHCIWSGKLWWSYSLPTWSCTCTWRTWMYSSTIVGYEFLRRIIVEHHELIKWPATSAAESPFTVTILAILLNQSVIRRRYSLRSCFVTHREYQYTRIIRVMSPEIIAASWHSSGVLSSLSHSAGSCAQWHRCLLPRWA